MAREYNKKGNPFKRGNTWTFIYYELTDGNKKVQKWKGGYKTKKEAEEDLKIYQAKSTLGKYVPNELTVEAYLTKWFNLHKQTLQPSTINGYHVNIYNHIIPQIGQIKLSDLKIADVQKLYLSMENEKGLSPKTIKYAHNVLKTALKYAVEDNLIEKNVCLYVKTPSIPKYTSQVLSQEQMQQLFNYVSNTQYEIEIKLATILGLRRGEVLGLRFSDYDSNNHTITIRQQVSTIKDVTREQNENYYGLKKLKSDSSNRTVGISLDTEKLIQRKKIYVENQKALLGENYHDNDLICCKDNGDIINPQTLYHAFKEIIKNAGLPNIRFHDLRHSYATMLIDLNIPIKVISQNLGHSSAAITDMVYADSISAKKSTANIVSTVLQC